MWSLVLCILDYFIFLDLILNVDICALSMFKILLPSTGSCWKVYPCKKFPYSNVVFAKLPGNRFASIKI